jgi:hypothetical protein
MTELLALLLERLPEWPPIKNDEGKIRAALHVLIPEPEWRHDCREDIKAALTLIEENEFSRRRKRDTRAIAQLLTALKPPKQDCRCLKPANLRTSATYKRALPFVSVDRASRSRCFRENLIGVVIGFSMPCRPHIIWCSCGWLLDVAFVMPTTLTNKAPGTSFQQSCSARTLTCSPTCRAIGRQSTELTPQLPMPRIAGENVINCLKWYRFVTRVGLEAMHRPEVP